MSYARFGSNGSDVYVFMHAGGFLDCCGCLLQEMEWIDDPEAFFGFYLKAVGEIIQTEFHTTQGMIDHLKLHIEAGHNVPDDVIPAILADDAENFPKA